MFIFKIHQEYDVTNEIFSRAVDCARTSIVSVLYDFDATVAVEGNIVSITASGLTEAECEDKIMGCFRQSNGAYYPEFLRLELLPRKA